MTCLNAKPKGPISESKSDDFVPFPFSSRTGRHQIFFASVSTHGNDSHKLKELAPAKGKLLKK
jgi:hypothetical protein